jgi:hypothetical protein
VLKSSGLSLFDANHVAGGVEHGDVAGAPGVADRPLQDVDVGAMTILSKIDLTSSDRRLEDIAAS